MASMTNATTTYDEVLYLSKTYPESHPDRLFTAATLLGLDPPRPDRARVLELGCATGGNLLPMAAAMPQARFVGLDLSTRQIEIANARAAAFGLTNLSFLAEDLADVDERLGSFDYILAHGVYSWVPAAVQDRLLEVVRERLAPNGVAFVSYNAMPGWGLRKVVRELMVWGGGDHPDALARLKRAREVLELATRLSPSNTAFGLVLREEAAMLRKLPDSYVRHDFLAERNEVLWFSEFEERLREAGLRYLTEATWAERFDFDLPPAVREAFEPLREDEVRWEQYKDYLRNRGFRENLIVRADAPEAGAPDPERLAGLHVVANVDLASDRDPLAPGEVDFRSREGATFGVEHPLTKAALVVLSELRPAGLPFEALVEAARERLRGVDPGEGGTGAEAARLAQNLLYSHAAGLLDLYPRDLGCAPRVSERPKVWEAGRGLAAEGSEYVATLRHESFLPTVFDRALIALLDGTRTLEEVVDALAASVETGALSLTDAAGAAFEHAEARRGAIAREVASRLPQLQRFALLEA